MENLEKIQEIGTTEKAWLEYAQAIDRNNDKLGNSLNIIESLTIPNAVSVDSESVTSGYYRFYDGRTFALSSYLYTNPILVPKGTVILGKQIDVSSLVSLVSKVDAEGNYISTFVRGKDGVQDYFSIINEDCYIEISCQTKQLSRFSIVSSKLTEDLLNILFQNEYNIEESTHLIALKDNPLANIIRDAGYGSIIHSWGIIGDSYASGEMDIFVNGEHNRYVDMYAYSWGQRFCKMIGADGYNFSNGGQTTKGWIEAGVVRDESYEGGPGGGGWSLAQQSEHLKQGYIIALGVNDKSKSYSIGSVDTDIDSTDYNKNAETFIGYYAGIIQRLKSVQPKAKIFCVTPLGTYYAEYATAIRSLVSAMNAIYEGDVYLIDLDTYYPISWSGQYVLNSHGSAMGYQYYAYAINTYIDWIIRNNGDAFKEVSLIGLDNV